MGRVVYMMNVSLDGFVATPDGDLDWGTVDEELHGWFNDRTREAGALVYGRRLYEVMVAYWPTADADPAATPVMREFGRIWNATPKVVFSTSLDDVPAGWRLIRGDVPGEVARLRDETDGDLHVGGPTLAAELVRRGMVDEYRLVVHPVVLGRGLPFFPVLDAPIRLRLIGTRRFATGAALLAYVPA